jgi:hypothetical protein
MVKRRAWERKSSERARELPTVLTDGTCHDVRVAKGGRITADGTYLYLLTPAAGASFVRAAKTTGFGRGGWLTIFSLLALSALGGRGLRRRLLWLLCIDGRLLIHLVN